MKAAQMRVFVGIHRPFLRRYQVAGGGRNSAWQLHPANSRRDKLLICGRLSFLSCLGLKIALQHQDYEPGADD